MLAGDFNRDGKQDLALLYSGPTIPSTDKGFSFLYNTSIYPDGACVVPAGPGINIRSPGLAGRGIFPCKEPTKSHRGDMPRYEVLKGHGFSRASKITKKEMASREVISG